MHCTTVQNLEPVDTWHNLKTMYTCLSTIKDSHVCRPWPLTSTRSHSKCIYMYTFLPNCLWFLLNIFLWWWHEHFSSVANFRVVNIPQSDFHIKCRKVKLYCANLRCCFNIIFLCLETVYANTNLFCFVLFSSEIVVNSVTFFAVWFCTKQRKLF